MIKRTKMKMVHGMAWFVRRLSSKRKKAVDKLEKTTRK